MAFNPSRLIGSSFVSILRFNGDADSTHVLKLLPDQGLSADDCSQATKFSLRAKDVGNMTSIDFAMVSS